MIRSVRTLRDAVRSLLRSPGSTLLAVVTLALGVGGACAVFSVAWQVLARPLPYPAAGDLVTVFTTELSAPDVRTSFSPASYFDLAGASETVTGWTAARSWSPTVAPGDGGAPPDQVPALLSTPGLFDLLGVPPHLGTLFRPPADGGDPGRVVVLSHDLWRSRFGGDPSAVGATMILDGEPYEVIGVMPRGFAFPPFWAREAELWAPLRLTPEEASSRRASYLRVFGRLAPDRTLPEARLEIEGLMAALAADHPDENGDLSAIVEPLREPVVRDARTPFQLLLGTVALVLLIACSNVAGLFLVRAAHREGEIALRVALGARPGELMRRELLESGLVALAGGALGWALAVGGIQVLRTLRPSGLPRADELAIDGAVFGLALGMSVLAALLAGAVPALRAVRRDPELALRSRGRSAAGGHDRVWRPLVAVQVAMTVLLLTGAALMGRSLVSLLLDDPGFRAEGVLTADLPLGGSAQAPAERQPLFFDQALEAVRAVPGVENAALVNHLPIGGDTWKTDLEIEGRPTSELRPNAVMRVAGPGYFDVMGIERLDGTGFGAERPDGPRVVMVNQALAALLPTDEPVGARLRSAGSAPGDPWWTVVGVVEDTRQERLRERALPEVYYPYAQNPFPWFEQTTLVARTRTGADPAAIVGAVREAVASVDPAIPVVRARPFADVLADDLETSRFLSGLLAVFAAASLLLSGIGLYGLVSFRVGSQRREIGIRMSLGASRDRILRRVLGQALSVVLAGLVPGLIVAAAVTGGMADLLYEVTADDPVSFGVAAAVLLAAALAAAWVPASRAMAVEPAETLRGE